MDFKHSSGMSSASARGSSENSQNSILRRSRGMQLAAAGASVLAAVAMTACSSGDGGDNGRPNFEQQQRNASGLLFTYPYNGQQNVLITSQISVRFSSNFSGDVDNALSLETDDDANKPSITIVPAAGQPGVYRIVPSQPLLGNTEYKVVANRALRAGNTSFATNDTLFQFTTAPRPGRPSAGNFRVTEASPGAVNPVTGRTELFTSFNTVHVSLSETIDPSTVIKGDTFKFTDADGVMVDGALVVSGHEITFDPTDNLEPGNYTLSLTDGVQSAFGKSLTRFSVSRNVLDTGKVVQQNLIVDNDEGFSGDVDDSPLNGLPDNVITLTNQLIGVNTQNARNKSSRGGVLSNLASPGMPGFGDVLPIKLPAGQVFELQPLTVTLNGEGGIPTPVESGPIQVQFSSDANVYLMANDLRSVITPTAVRLRFDLNNTTLISAAPGTPEYIIEALSNGIFNQSSLNIQAAGLAAPQDNGDVVVNTIGTFPLTVSRTNDLTVDFALTLRLAAAEQTPVQPDTVAPYLAAVVPSACFYGFGSTAYQALYTQVSPVAFPEGFCRAPLNGQPPPAGGLGVSVTSFPIESSPALIFSEPLDPLSVNSDSITLADSNGNTVDVTYELDGDSVTINPTDQLQPNTQYTITLNGNSSLRDLGGRAMADNNTTTVLSNNVLTTNPVVPTIGGSNTIQFTTEPLVQGPNAAAPVLLGQLSPGLTCAVEGGDFATGGNSVGHCVGDQAETSADFAVFNSPTNIPVNGYFSKFVARDSVVLANGCLTPGSGTANSTTNATVALEQIDASGQCVGTVPASLGFPNLNGDSVRGFSIRPNGLLDEGSRYWVVVCGTTRGTPRTSCSAQITDLDGFALNTNPIDADTGTGSTPSMPADAAEGGPDIVIPFVASAYSDDFYSDQFTLPATDTNGNGQFDDTNVNGIFDNGDERPQVSNRTLVRLELLGQQIRNANRADGKYPSYLALNRPVVIGKTTNSCGVVSQITNQDGTSVVGEDVSTCIPVSLLPGGINDLTGIAIPLPEALGAITGVVINPLTEAFEAGTPLGDIPILGPLLSGIFSTVDAVLDRITSLLGEGIEALIPVQGSAINTGRLVLRFGGGTNVEPQFGYIVEKCAGSNAGQEYDFEPCFLGRLNLTVNAPDGQGVSLAQQAINVNVAGPVTFEQTGRLVIPVKNANQFTLDARALNLIPATATIAPGDLNLQLSASEAHGGRAFPQR